MSQETGLFLSSSFGLNAPSMFSGINDYEPREFKRMKRTSRDINKKVQYMGLFQHICIFSFITTYNKRNRKHDSLYADRATVQTRRWSATRFLGGAWEWALSSGKMVRLESWWILPLAWQNRLMHFRKITPCRENSLMKTKSWWM